MHEGENMGIMTTLKKPTAESLCSLRHPCSPTPCTSPTPTPLASPLGRPSTGVPCPRGAIGLHRLDDTGNW